MIPAVAVIEVDNVRKRYGSVIALDGVTASVNDGEFFGVLGSNGAGKTTLIRIVASLLVPSSGSVVVGGHEVTRHPDRVRRLVGYAAQATGIDNDLTVRENLVFRARLYGIARKAAVKRCDELIDSFGLESLVDRRAATLSGGMRRRLDVAQALVHRPKILLLDEPSVGMDPRARHALWEQLQMLNQQGTSIVLTTHYLDEADELCERLVIIDSGRVTATGTPAGMKAAVGDSMLYLELDVAEAEHLEHALTAVQAAVQTSVVARNRVLVVPLDGPESIGRAVTAAASTGAGIAMARFGPPSLDEVFLRHTATGTGEPDTADRPMTSFAVGSLGGRQR